MVLAVGTPAPAFTTTDTTGKPVSLADFAGKTVVLYFYPKDDTPGCTKEACSFRDNYAAYQEKGIVVLGVSGDDEASHQKFTEKFSLPFPLLADVNKSIIKAYDVDGGGYAKRVTYVIDGNGIITHVYTSVKTDTHATDILADLGL
ncbi:peroxiredoxin [Synechococcus sp. PCC 6717]|jgi:peroxiredoxin Q/BCP|uniref:thioredoxin-dependent peroxiredoxin n=1 Tax=Parathermosynechococcus lividus PCC 6715 TaxID=1917166 RepID=A0A2D2Q2J3_PARLV|nr:peroxiredoxin [Thermostichus lividus]ATS18723.1 peroxiredoxin [Thermostichus lividus PCC 6715]MCH9055522.1 peroxiredoxin [Synechococcus sp. PCC 6716]MCI3281542.1 peroxiredoxin [Synechococcus sp. PCC 6717]